MSAVNQTDLAKLEGLVDKHWNGQQIRLIADQVAKKSTPAELALFLQVAKGTGLDPFRKQIHAVHRYDKKLGREVMSIQVGIDGYRAIAERTGTYAGNDDPVFEEGQGHPTRATVTVWRIVGGQRVPFSATARWTEYAPEKGPGTFMWRRMPHLMLGKCAEALALRKAFPGALSGLYTDEEMHQADARVVDVDARVSEPARPPRRQAGERAPDAEPDPDPEPAAMDAAWEEALS